MVAPNDAQEGFFALRRDLPFESRFLEYNGFKIHYLDEGSGPVVFLLHGNPTWCFFYRNLIGELKKNFRVIAIDYIGCGLSDHPEDAHFRARDRVAEVEYIYRHLGISSFSVVMHDWGGAIGTKFLQAHLDRVQGIVYLNTTLTEVESLPPMIKASAHPLIGKFLTKYTKQFLRYLIGPGAVKKLSRAVKEGYLYPYQTMARRTAIWDFVRDIPFEHDHPTYPDMVELAEGFRNMSAIPVKIVWGLQDPCFHPYMLRKVAAHFPHAEIVEIADAGHLVLEDAPEVTNREISTFLQSVVSGAYAKSIVKFNARPGVNALYQALKTLPESLHDQAAAIIPHVVGTAMQYSPITYRELLTRINQYHRGLVDLGLRPGDRVLMLVPPGEEFLSLTYAVMACGAIPAFVDPGVGKDKLFKCIKDCDPHALIGAPKAHLLRLKGRTLFPNLKFSLWATHTWSFGGTNLSFLRRFSAAELPAEESPEGISFIAFTSGATGTPKGVIFTNKMIEAALKIFTDVFGFQHHSKDLPLLPIFSIFSCALGVSSVFPPMDAAKPLSLDPSLIVRIIKDLGVHSSFGSPTLWDKISDYCMRHSEQLPSLTTLLMAGAPVSMQLLDRVERLSSGCKVFTPYGATECLPVTAAPAAEIRALQGVTSVKGELGTPVGKPVTGTRIRVIKLGAAIIREIEETVECAPLEVGEILVQAPQASPLYLNRVDANLQGKIRDGDTFWHRIGDVGYVDTAGNLFYCGRKSHVVEVGESVFYSDPVENIFNQNPKVRRTALIKAPDGSAALAVEPLSGQFPDNQAKREQFVGELRELSKTSPVTQMIQKYYFFRTFPVDARHNAKIFRDELTASVEQGAHA